MPSHAIQAAFSEKFTQEMYLNIRRHRLLDFEGMVIFFNGKGFKGDYMSTSYTELSRSWNEKWRSEIDERHVPREQYWLDLGRQMGPGSPVAPADVDSCSGGSDCEPVKKTLLWKPCCIKTYYDYRTKVYKHASSMPLVKYHFAGLRDVISASMTARAKS